MKPSSNTYTITATDVDGICQSQTPLAAGNLTINGALAAGIPTQQHVTIAGGSNESGKTFTIYGIDQGDQVISEPLAGPNAGTVTSVLNYKAVTRVAVSAATTGAVTVGVVAALETPWLPLDTKIPVFNVGYQVDITTATFELQGTLDTVQDSTITPLENTLVASGSADIVGNLTGPVSALRLKITAWTTGTVSLKVLQQG
jgi:hypothetical protein